MIKYIVGPKLAYSEYDVDFERTSMMADVLIETERRPQLTGLLDVYGWV